MTLLLMLLFKSFFVFALSGVVLLCLRRASAATRHLVCLLTLSALLALPLFSLTLPGWHVAALSTTDPLPPPILPMASEKDPPAPNNGGVRTSRAEAEAALVPAEAPAARSASAPPLLGAGGNPFPLPLLFLYLIGFLLAGLRPLLGLWGISRLRRVCIPVTDTPALTLSADCASMLHLPRLPQLCRADVCVPMTWGWRHPIILLPAASVDWPEGRLRSVLLHEMAHVKRHDWPAHRLADFVCALYWFHPLVWLTARRLRAESEVACDDLVLSSGIPAPDYARHLLDIARALPRPLPSQSAIAMAQTPHIKRRILMVLDSTRSRRTLTRRALLVVLIPSAAALLTLAALRPSVKAQAMPPQAASLSAAGSINTEATTLQTTIDTEGKTLYIFSPDLKINGTTLFAGMTDADKPGSSWWSATGALLPTPVYDTNAYRAENHAGSSTHNVSFAFRLPSDEVGSTFKYQIAGCVESSSEGFWVTKINGRNLRSEAQLFPQTQGTRVVTAAFPLSLAKTTVQIGIASGPWKTAAQETFAHSLASPSGGTDSDAADTGSSQTTPAGTFIFSAIRPEPGNASGLTVTTTEPKQDLRIVALDTQGHLLLPSSIGDNSAAELDQITIHFAQPISQIKEIRVETRPFLWVEFKDVALQPSAVTASEPSQTSGAVPDAAAGRLHKIYEFLQIYRRTHSGAFPVTNSPGLMGDMVAHPQTYGLPDQGAGNQAQALHFFTSPDSRFMDGGGAAAADRMIVYFLHNKRPDGTLVGSAKPAGTRDVLAYSNLYVRNHPHGATGFYLVLWDDGTVSRIPAGEALAVPAYDVLGSAGATQEAIRGGVKQVAFPGQAGLAKS